MYAMKSDVTEGFKSAGSRMDSLDGDLNKAKELIQKLSMEVNTLRRFKGNVGNSYADMPSNILFTEEHAKMIGECVFSVLGKPSEEQKDMYQLVNSGGGVLVPDSAMSRIIDLMAKYGKFRSNTSVLPIGSGTTNIPKIEADMTVYCPGEGNEITDSDMSFSQVKLHPKTWAALAKVSNELDQDSIIAIGYVVGLSITRSMAKQEDRVGFLGDGTEAYFGHTGIIGQFKKISETLSEVPGIKVGTGTSWGDYTLGDFDSMIALLPEDFDDDAKFYCSKAFHQEVMQTLARSAGAANIFEILSDRKSRYFKGYEVVFVSCMPKTSAGNQIDCILGDLSVGSYLGERKQLEIHQSKDVFFKNYQTGVLGVERVDVNVFGCGDETNPGPIVGLATKPEE